MKNICKDYQPVLFYTIIAVMIGVLVGAIDALFGRVLLAITDFRGQHVLILVPFLAFAGLLIIFLYQKFSPKAQKGMTLIFETGFDQNEEIPKALIPIIMVTTWITHLFGGSAGREGVAVQIGATLSHTLGTALGRTKLGEMLIHPDEVEELRGRMQEKQRAAAGDSADDVCFEDEEEDSSEVSDPAGKRNPSAASDVTGKRLSIITEKDNGRIFLVIGMAAGFGGLFQTPLAATFFAIEVLVAGALVYDAVLPALAAAYVASYTSHLLGLGKFTVDLTDTIPYDAEHIVKLIAIAVIFGVVGGLFSHFLAGAKSLLAKKMPNPYVRIFAMGIGLSVVFLILFRGRYCGLGTNLISASFTGETVYSWDFALKFTLTILTLASGFQGGEVTPLFSIGATLGVLLASVFGLPVMFAAALGYAAVFGSATNTLAAPIFIGVEVFGAGYAVPFAIVCIIAFVCNGNKTIYGKQRISRMKDFRR